MTAITFLKSTQQRAVSLVCSCRLISERRPLMARPPVWPLRVKALIAARLIQHAWNLLQMCISFRFCSCICGLDFLSFFLSFRSCISIPCLGAECAFSDAARLKIAILELVLHVWSIHVVHLPRQWVTELPSLVATVLQQHFRAWKCWDETRDLVVVRCPCHSETKVWCFCCDRPCPLLPFDSYRNARSVCHPLLRSITSRAPMDTWMAWANKDPSKLWWKRACSRLNIFGCSPSFSLTQFFRLFQVPWGSSWVLKSYVLQTHRFAFAEHDRNYFPEIYTAACCQFSVFLPVDLRTPPFDGKAAGVTLASQGIDSSPFDSTRLKLAADVHFLPFL